MEKQLTALQAKRLEVAEKIGFDLTKAEKIFAFVLGDDLAPKQTIAERPTETSISILMSSGDKLTPIQYETQNCALGDVVGVLVETPLISFVVAPDEYEEKFSEDNEKVYVKEYTEAEAYMLTDGHASTRQLVEAQANEGMTAAKRAWEYGRLGLQWHLPCLLQLSTMCAHQKEINKCLKAISGVPLSTGGHWSSTEGSAGYSWYVYFGSGDSGNGNKFYAYVVRPDVAYPL